MFHMLENESMFNMLENCLLAQEIVCMQLTSPLTLRGRVSGEAIFTKAGPLIGQTNHVTN